MTDPRNSSRCMGTNCKASICNNFSHSVECLREYEHTIDMNRVRVSLSQMKYWLEQLNEHGCLAINQVVEDMNGYIETKEKDMLI